MKNKNEKKQNKPYYMNDFGKVEKSPEKNVSHQKKNDPMIIKKFQLGIDKNNNPIVTIDNVMHFMNQKTFYAFTMGIININKKLNPEADFNKFSEAKTN